VAGVRGSSNAITGPAVWVSKGIDACGLNCDAFCIATSYCSVLQCYSATFCAFSRCTQHSSLGVHVTQAPSYVHFSIDRGICATASSRVVTRNW